VNRYAGNVLIGDIGGTNSRLGICDPDGAISCVAHVRNNAYPDLSAVLSDYLATVSPPPCAALLAVAGPVREQQVTLTNLGWSIAADQLQKRLGLRAISLLNDFAAVAHAVPVLQEDDRRAIGDVKPRHDEPIAVIGPGTGLGVAGLLKTAAGWSAVIGEGGHVTLPAADDEEAALLSTLRSQIGHVSAERLISGPGLLLLYRTLAAREGAVIDSTVNPEQVCALARDGNVLARRAVAQMFLFLGTVAADLALSLGAEGGVYIAGGLIPGNLDLFERSAFRQRFEQKGRFSGYLRDIPTYVITRSEPALLGLCRLVGQITLRKL
jgi:glucokinase